MENLKQEREFQEAVVVNTEYEMKEAQERFNKIYQVHQKREERLVNFANSEFFPTKWAFGN